MSLSTHVLDLASGRPAAGVAVTLEVRAPEGDWRQIAHGRSDADGRVGELADDGLVAGTHRLTFEIGDYFSSQGIASFHPEAAVTFHVADPGEHYHVPLLVSPYGYTTYRGS